MIYRDFKELKLPALAFGTMRMPEINGKYADIDEVPTEEMIDYAYAHGVNLFDSGWGYHEGNAEPVTAKLLKKYPRESYFFSTKFPGYDLENMDKVEEIFEQQLEKCHLEYFDFYLIHNVCELNIDAYLDEKYGMLSYLKKQKENGRIRHLGFSLHGTYAVLSRFLEARGADMEFCLMQLNYVDWFLQDAKQAASLLNEKNIPIWVMEPLRGGKLATLSAAHSQMLNALRPDDSIPAWAFRFVQSVPGVLLTLSGMSNLSQLQENIEIFAKQEPLSEQERLALFTIAGEMISSNGVPCTDCKYCLSHCPQSLNIPELLRLYNEHCFTEDGFIAPMALDALPEQERPAACTACHSCEAVCPQKIKIADAFSDFVQQLSEQED